MIETLFTNIIADALLDHFDEEGRIQMMFYEVINHHVGPKAMPISDNHYETKYFFHLIEPRVYGKCACNVRTCQQIGFQ